MMECLGYEGIKAILSITEGVPEHQARKILWKANEKGVLIIGLAPVGGIKPGWFRISNFRGCIHSIALDSH
jgi:ATP citrate (pro-S)-lyase